MKDDILSLGKGFVTPDIKKNAKVKHIVIEAYDIDMDYRYPLTIILYDNKKIKTIDMDTMKENVVDGTFKPQDEERALLVLGSNAVDLVLHETLHVALDFLRKACNTNPARLIEDPLDIVGEEAFIHTVHNIFVQIYEAVK